MEINITYKSPEHEAAFLSELQRIPHIVNPESGRVNPYWGASLYLLSALTRWPELRIAVIGEDYMMFTAAKEAFNLSQNERIVVELAAAFYNAGLWEMPGFEMVCATCDTAFALILEAFRLRRAKLFYKDGEVSAEWEKKEMSLRRAVAVLSFIGTDDFGREVFVDELGTIWKYTEPGAMPRERHDKLYTASSNGRDGEPDLPMSDAFDYKIIN